ncbi:hypothetical protein PL8927_740018 [Planktothrix serta PCC 8927]|uniref:site-specific DNA-methyltransferase (adenine-specific) n=1 Tax=Planktothrix serta PCC 8927 TaxID=671068 RepID=A0A7Z9BZC7_9CYAN|nr:N-6 DNA methylase [Planktothrix serta]VXD22213.1 hypothetical protein PL8927_740018 [Planktothrix serta PCC 8927]
MKTNFILSPNSYDLIPSKKFSAEFKQTAFVLIQEFKNQSLRSFLKEKFEISEKEVYVINVKFKESIQEFIATRNKSFGVFYTPFNIADKIISTIKIDSNFSYLEPSVGTGNFIILLIEKIRQTLPNISLDNLLKSIYGFEIDNEALEICKLRVLLYLENYYFIDQQIYNKLNFYVTDFTIKAPFGFDFLKNFNSLYQDSPEVLEIKKSHKFDYIFGNPPFITFYGRRSKKLLESYRKYYLENYEFIPNSVMNGKLNSYMFFIEQGLNLLNKNGHLIYLLDNSIYETSGEHIRKWIIANFQIHSITQGFSDFNNVCSGQTIWHIIQCKPETEMILEDHNSDHKPSQKINQCTYLNSLECKIDFQQDNLIIAQFKKYKNINYYFPGKSIRTCCMLLNLTDKFLVTPEEYKQDESGLIMPYLEGGKSLSHPDEPFKFEKYIKYDYQLQLDISEEIRKQLEQEGVKNKKRIGLGKLEVYQAPKIFIRQSSNKLIAKFTTENFMANNSLYVLTPIYSNFSFDIWEDILIYTERLLCSTLYSYLAHQLKVIRKNVKQQPQIKISDLKQLPFVLDTHSDFFREIIEVNPINRKKIDSIIYENLCISTPEIKKIEFFLQSV